MCKLHHSQIKCMFLLLNSISLLPEQFNSLKPSDTIWQYESGSTLAQVMACCLMAPSHYLSQCCLIIKGAVTFTWGQYLRKCSRYISLLCVWKVLFKNTTASPKQQWVNFLSGHIERPGTIFSVMPFWAWDSFHKWFFNRNSNSMENWFGVNCTVWYHIATIFCTCHYSTAVMPCAKFHSDYFAVI